MSAAPGLARQHTLLLASAFVLTELLVVAVFIVFVMLPFALRSADDLAGLMILAAQTWAELPPQTRPDFEAELLASHALALRTDALGRGLDEWHPPYFYLIEDALARRIGAPQHLVRSGSGDDAWYWVSLPAGEGSLGVGMSQRRIGAQPVAALLIVLAGGLVFAMLSAVWLARRIAAPLARLERAAAQIGQGGSPPLLPEDGPRELATLAHRFNAMARQVQDLLSARTTLLAGVSHDLRTPLARMRLALEMLKLDATPALIARLENDIDEMNALIGKVLDVARGLAREAPTDVDVAALLVELAERAPAGAVSCSGPAAAGPLHVPPLALRRVVGNLLDNALRHAGGCPIELVCAADAWPPRIGVLDRGPGIPPDQLAAVFEPFHRVEPSRNPATGGSGLGLAIVLQVARANGWRVELRNRSGGGLEAWLELAPEVRGA
jgi:two-component system osmolarity sensor histidine kinase EnvZ